MRLSIFVFAILLATSAPRALAQQALTAEQQAEIAAAEVNREHIATRARWVDGPEANYPESERALGHHGTVMVRGLLGVDGRLRFVSIERSSRAPILDQSALVSAMGASLNRRGTQMVRQFPS